MRASAERPLILASGSSVRRRLLEDAGATFQVAPAAIDEAAIRDRLMADDPAVEAASVADELARAKARHVSRQHTAALVIGADQVLVHDGRIISKAHSIGEAREQLMALRGSTHTLFSAAALAEGGACTWGACETARLTMRRFSPGFLDDYLARAGEAVLASVGCYQLEGRGLQLFERIDGDFFTVLGMPMLALLAELRVRGVMAS